MAGSSEHGVLQPLPEPSLFWPLLWKSSLELCSIEISARIPRYCLVGLSPSWRDSMGIVAHVPLCVSVYCRPEENTLEAIRKREAMNKKQAMQRKQELCSRSRHERKSGASQRHSRATAHVSRRANHRVHQNHHNRRGRW